MKITINKNQQKLNFNTHVENIITIAKQTAQEGRERFTYPYPKGLGFGGYELINEVEKQTDESVYGTHRDGVIRFAIRD